MSATSIPYTAVAHSSALLLDYLYHYNRVARFYNGSPFDSASYHQLALKIRSRKQDRQEIAAILTQQNRTYGCSELTLANIQRLSEPGTFAVVTGQQAGLFSGPAFTLYKALTTVRLAQSLTEQGLSAVPVFWLATEDHDLEEVAKTAVFDDEYNLVTLHDPGERPAPRSSVGYVRLSAGIRAELDRLEGVIPPGQPRDQLLGDLRECFEPGSSWGLAFARFMSRLFSRWGVILLDPLDDSVHRLSTVIYQQALRGAEELRVQVMGRSNELLRSGYHAQVHVAEDSTLVFLTRDGSRLPVHRRNGEYLLDGKEHVSLAGLEARLHDHPVDFSSNVLLRPIVQDTLLPTLAYVAGPSELAYLGQAAVLYEAFNLPQPVVFPRAAFTLVDARTERLLAKYRLNLAEVWRGEEHLSRKIAAAGFAEGWSERFDQDEHDLAELLERLHRDIEKIDPTLLDTLQHVKEKITYQMQRLRGKVSRAALSRSDLLRRHEQTLLRFLQPHKDLQERRVSGIYFLGRAGYEILEFLLAHIQTHCSDHQMLTY